MERHRAAHRADPGALMVSFSRCSEHRERFAPALSGSSQTLNREGENRVVPTKVLKPRSGATAAGSLVGAREQ